VLVFGLRRTGDYILSSSCTRTLTKPGVRCARNCFVCPACENTLAVVPSDPHEGSDLNAASNAPVSTVGEPPFFLYCNHCRWDSAEVGITFEKPTGLASNYL
jgi:dynactin-4